MNLEQQNNDRVDFHGSVVFRTNAVFHRNVDFHERVVFHNDVYFRDTLISSLESKCQISCKTEDDFYATTTYVSQDNPQFKVRKTVSTARLPVKQRGNPTYDLYRLAGDFRLQAKQYGVVSMGLDIKLPKTNGTYARFELTPYWKQRISIQGRDKREDVPYVDFTTDDTAPFNNRVKGWQQITIEVVNLQDCGSINIDGNSVLFHMTIKESDDDE